MKIAIVPWNDDYMKNQMFNISNKKLNRDHLMTPYLYMKKEFEKNGDELNTVDMYSDITEVDYFLFFELWLEWIKLISDKHLENRMIYCNAEPEVVKPINSSEGYVKLKKIFPYIMTWNEELVDGDRIFKRIIPYYIERKPGNIPFCNRKLITNISGNNSSKNSKELYSERERAITFFEKNYSRQFDLYGTGWDVKEHPSYKGTPENKYEIYHKYKFALALENTKDVTGYVTEKIYDCLVAGTVPIYEGAKDIIKHVPQECFIDYSRFVSLQELADYLTGMTESEYYNFQRSIENFLDSGIETSLGGAAYAQNIYFVINKNTQSNFRIAKFRRAIIGVYILRKNLFENIKIFLKKSYKFIVKRK